MDELAELELVVEDEIVLFLRESGIHGMGRVRDFEVESTIWEQSGFSDCRDDSCYLQYGIVAAGRGFGGGGFSLLEQLLKRSRFERRRFHGHRHPNSLPILALELRNFSWLFCGAERERERVVGDQLR